MNSKYYLSRKVSTETLFKLILLIIATYMFVKSGEYTSRASVFPQVISGVAILGCILLIMGRVLPDQLQSLVLEDTHLVAQADQERMNKYEQDLDKQSITSEDVNKINSFYTGIQMGFYLIFAYLFGFIIATPVFIASYVIVNEINRLYGLALAILSFGIVYSFTVVLNAPLNKGLIYTLGI
jgi:hypothetical protein